MSNIYSILVIVTLICSTCISKRSMYVSDTSEIQTPGENQMTDYYEQSTWLLGYFSRERMTELPHSEWYTKGYDEYMVDSKSIDELKDIEKKIITIKIVMGTWCSDSRREVPRFMHILDYWEFPVENVTFIGVDDLKISPVGEYEYLGIERVPTFIFYKNNIEAGRIIENPVTSLEKDMVKIITGNE